MTHSSLAKRLVLLTLLVLASQQAFTKDHFGIVNYHPIEFAEQFSRPVFYAIGFELKYGASIEPDARAIYRFSSYRVDGLSRRPSPLMAVSPDANKIVIADKDNVLIANKDGNISNVYSNLKVRRALAKSPPPGSPYLQSFRWSPDSRFVYLVVRENLSSGDKNDASILRIDAVSPFEVKVVGSLLPTFDEYFVLDEETICFDYFGEDRRGSHKWKCTSGEIVSSVDDQRVCFVSGNCVEPNSVYQSSTGKSEIIRRRINAFVFVEIPSACVQHGFTSQANPNTTTTFSFKERVLFVVHGGYNIKGSYVDGTSCIDVMPGGRYATFALHTDDFEGTILVDGQTGNYRALPRFTTVLGPTEPSIGSSVR